MRAYTKLKLAILLDVVLILMLAALSTVVSTAANVVLIIMIVLTGLDLIAAVLAYLRWR